MRSVETVLETEAVPVHSGVEVALVRHMDGDRGALRSDERWAGNRAVVGEHSNHRAAYLFLHGSDLERDLVSHARAGAAPPAARLATPPWRSGIRSRRSDGDASDWSRLAAILFAFAYSTRSSLGVPAESIAKPL